MEWIAIAYITETGKPRERREYRIRHWPQVAGLVQSIEARLAEYGKRRKADPNEPLLLDVSFVIHPVPE